MRQNYGQQQYSTIRSTTLQIFSSWCMWTQYISLIFFVPRSFGPHQSGPLRRGMFAPFGNNMVQTLSCRHSWTTTTSNSRFPAWSQTLSSSGSSKSPHGQQNTEAISWCAEQTPHSNTTRLFMMFPEDQGGPSQEGPTSIWDLREFQTLHGVNEACRGAGFYVPAWAGRVQTSSGNFVEHRKSLWQAPQWMAMPHSKQRGPPSQRPTTEPLPKCPPHQNIKGVEAADHFVSASSCTLGERFWMFFLNNNSSHYNRRPAGMTTRQLPTIPISTTPPGLSPLLAPSLACSSDSLRMFLRSLETR